MKITEREATLLRLACETRMNVLTRAVQHPVLSTCFNEVDRNRLCSIQEEYVRLLRKVEASRKATLRGIVADNDVEG